MLAHRSPMDFVDPGMRLQAARTRHEFRTQRRRAIDRHTRSHHARRLSVIDAELGDLDAVSMEIAIDLAAHRHEMLARTDDSKPGRVASGARCSGLDACTPQEQVKQTHDNSCPGDNAGDASNARQPWFEGAVRAWPRADEDGQCSWERREFCMRAC